MALSLQPSVFVKQRALALPGLPARLSVLLGAFLSLITQYSGDLDLAVVPYDLDASDTLEASDVPARVWAVVAFCVHPGGFIAVTVGDSGDDPIVWLEADDLPDTDHHNEAFACYTNGGLPPTNSNVTIQNQGVNQTRGLVILGAA